MKQTEAEFLAQYDPAAFERPSVAVDVAIFTLREGALHALLIGRDEHPFLGARALPGGFVRMDEDLDAAAARVLEQKGGVTGVRLEQLAAFGAVHRDPRTRVISVLYLALVPEDRLRPPRGRLLRVELPPRAPAGTPARAIEGDTAVNLAFDHAILLGEVVQRLRAARSRVAFGLLPERFSLRQLHAAHEAVLGRPLNYPAFRRKVLGAGVLLATGEREEEVGHRPAELFRYVPGETEDEHG